MYGVWLEDLGHGMTQREGVLLVELEINNPSSRTRRMREGRVKCSHQKAGQEGTRTETWVQRFTELCVEWGSTWSLENSRLMKGKEVKFHSHLQTSVALGGVPVPPMASGELRESMQASVVRRQLMSYPQTKWTKECHQRKKKAKKCIKNGKGKSTN